MLSKRKHVSAITKQFKNNNNHFILHPNNSTISFATCTSSFNYSINTHNNDNNTDTPLGAKILKVNHAGEHGAINIYSAQILMAKWTAPSLVHELSEFKSHEMRHCEIFRKELQRRGIPQCKTYFWCGLGGYTLGLISGLCGRRAILATTVAVESTVLEHLKWQIAELDILNDRMGVEAIRSIELEEREHCKMAEDYLLLKNSNENQHLPHHKHQKVANEGIVEVFFSVVVKISTEECICSSNLNSL